MFGIIRSERADHFAQCRRGKPFGIIFGSRQPCETRRQAERTDFVGMARRQIQRNQSAERPAENVGRRVNLGGNAVCRCLNIEGLREGRVAVSGQIDGGHRPRCRQARHQIVEHVAVRPPTVYQVNFFDGIRHGFSLLLAAHRRRAHYQALRIMPRFVRRFRRHLRWLPQRFGGIPHRRGKQLPPVFQARSRRRGVRRLSEKTARIRPDVGFAALRTARQQYDTRAEALG